jgi:3-oxoacyl-[acyl-carrier protein] reductase
MKNEVSKLFKDDVAIDVLVNNAGVAHGGLFQMTPMKVIRDVFDVNLFSHMELTQLVLKQMVKRKSGAIINVASISGIDLARGDCAYGVSKASLIAFTQVLAAEVGIYGIRVNAVAPGFTDTDMVKWVDDQSIILDNAMNRLARPDEIAKAVHFLASDNSSFINGQTIIINGGGAKRDKKAIYSAPPNEDFQKLDKGLPGIRAGIVINGGDGL